MGFAGKMEGRRTDSNRLPLLQLRVITQALQGCAGDCKCRILGGVSFPCLAACCTVLRCRWYQSGIRTSDRYSPTAGPVASPRDLLLSHNPNAHVQTRTVTSRYVAYVSRKLCFRRAGRPGAFGCVPASIAAALLPPRSPALTGWDGVE